MIESAGAAPASVSPRGEARWARRAGVVALLVGLYALLAFMLLFVSPGLFGFKAYSGVGNSMGETIPDGSMVLTRPVAAADVDVGEVISFRWPGFEHTITHRVVQIRRRGDAVAFVTKGDGNGQIDPYLTFGDQRLEQVIFAMPRVGAYLSVVRAIVLASSFGAAYVLWRRHQVRRQGAQRLRTTAAATRGS
jgi:signal peptidase